MRTTVIARPFAGGYRSDAPDYVLNPNEAAFAQDLIFEKGIAHQRWGWAYDGTSTVAAEDLVGVVRAKFPITGVTRTAVSVSEGAGSNKGKIYVHNESSVGSIVWTNPATVATAWLPRCVYNGEVIFCAQDGITPLVRWAGSNKGTTTVTGKNWKVVNGRVSITGDGGGSQFTTLEANVEKGMFASARYPRITAGNSMNPLISARILAAAGGAGSYTSLTLDSIRNFSLSADSAVVANDVIISACGAAWPAVSVSDVGTMTRTSSTANVESVWTANEASLGTTAINTTGIHGDALLILNNTAGGAHRIASVTAASGSDVTVGAELETQTSAMYRILRRCPFKDAAVHKGSLWGTGVSQYPNRVYVAAPGANIGIAPGSIEPHDPVAQAGYSNTTVTGFTDLSDFVLASYDVPSAYDGDPVVAILATPGPLLVLKRDSVYGIYGTFPNFEVKLLTNGAGCIDRRSAVTVNGVAYWAGPDGVFSYSNGQIQNLTLGRIGKEWRGLMSGYTTTVEPGYYITLS